LEHGQVYVCLVDWIKNIIKNMMKANRAACAKQRFDGRSEDGSFLARKQKYHDLEVETSAPPLDTLWKRTNCWDDPKGKPNLSQFQRKRNVNDLHNIFMVLCCIIKVSA